MIEVVDYGGGNLGSITRCLEMLDANYCLVNRDNPPSGEKPLLFPGVGAFGAAMHNLNQNGLAERLRDILKSKTPYLGICIGLQVLFEGSEEAPGVAGLGVIPGTVVKFTQGKVPQIGWNWVQSNKIEWNSGYVYFVNSYYPQLESNQQSLYEANYHGAFTAAVQTENITAFQFHPEKSGPFGQSLIAQWIENNACN
jgi:imidazole glycerol phosphate synthase glutamine amidotransferase subunit